MYVLELYSQLALFSAIVLYALAFIFYSIDLANRVSAVSVDKRSDAQGSLSSKTSVFSVKKGANKSKLAGVAFAFTVLAWVFHFVALVLRGAEAGRVPWANMYEFALTATFAITTIFLLVNFFINVKFLGTLIVFVVVLFLTLTRVGYYVLPAALPPSLDSNWLIIHIVVAILAVGFFTVSATLALIQILKISRNNRVAAMSDDLRDDFLRKKSLVAIFPDADVLESASYRTAIVGFVFWSFTLIAGAIWAEHAWSRYWGWDTKEVWTFVIWVLYAGYIHARLTRGWSGRVAAWLNIVAYSAVIFNFTIVNIFFEGLHSYSGLS